MKRPLLKALLLRDMDVIGKLARSERHSAVAIEKLTGFKAYLEFLRERDLVRTDLSVRQQVYMLSAILMGFFLAGPLLPQEFTVADEELADLMAETVHRALESGRSVSPDELQTITQALRDYLSRYSAVVREQFRQELDV